MNAQIERIIAVTTKNGIPLDKNFNLTYLATHGFYEGPEAVARKVIEEMEKLCFLGMNGGFDNQLKSALDKLSEVVTDLTCVKQGDIRELSKLDGKKNKILETVRESAYPVKYDFRNTVHDYISSSADAIDTIISLNSDGEIFSTVDKRQIEYLNESKEKLLQISIALASIMDVGSAQAKDYAEKMIAEIRGWRKDCARFMCTSRSVSRLDKALAYANDWGKIAVAPAKRDREKFKPKDVPQYQKDEMSIIAESRGGLETLSVFNARIQTRLAEIDNMSKDLNADRAKCSELRTELAELEKKKKQIAIEFKNSGDAVKANREIAEVRRRGEELESEIKSLEGNGRLARKEKDIRNRREIALHIKHICDTLTDNKSDLVFLAKVIQHVDFNALVGVMTGRNRDMDEARESILQIRVRVDNLRQTFMEGAEILNDEEEITNSILDEDIIEEEEPVKLTQDGLDPELAKLLQDFDQAEEKEEKEENSSELRRIIPLDDDDK